MSECAGYSRKSGSRLGDKCNSLFALLFSMLITWRRSCETKSRVQSPESKGRSGRGGGRGGGGVAEITRRRRRRRRTKRRVGY